MTLSLSKFAAVFAFLAAGAAQATVSPLLTINAGESVTYAGWTVSNARGTATLTFDKTLTSALNLAGIKVTGINPAIFSAPQNAAGGYTSISAAANVTAGMGYFDDVAQQLTVVGVKSAGGATLVAVDDGATTTGGSVSINNLRVDLSNATTGTVYASLSGANGVVAGDMAMWTFLKTNMTGQTVFPAVVGTTTSDNTISGLTITTGAFDYFAQALGLNDFGKTAMSGVKSYGKIVSSISMDVAKAVPEPSTYALMGLGLVGIVFARRRTGTAA